MGDKKKKDKKYKKKHKFTKPAKNVQVAKAQHAKAHLDKKTMKAGSLVPYTPQQNEVGTYDRKKSEWLKASQQTAMLQQTSDMQAKLAVMKQAQAEAAMMLKNINMRAKFDEQFRSQGAAVADLAQELTEKLVKGGGKHRKDLWEFQEKAKRIQPEGVIKAGGMRVDEGIQIEREYGASNWFQTSFVPNAFSYTAPPDPEHFRNGFGQKAEVPASEERRLQLVEPRPPVFQSFHVADNSGPVDLARYENEVNPLVRGHQEFREYRAPIVVAQPVRRQAYPKKNFEMHVTSADGSQYKVRVTNGKVEMKSLDGNTTHIARDFDQLRLSLKTMGFADPTNDQITKAFMKRGQYPIPETKMALKYSKGLPVHMTFQNPYRTNVAIELKVTPEKA
jgi:hypothetical protein